MCDDSAYVVVVGVAGKHKDGSAFVLVVGGLGSWGKSGLSGN